jgi:hypothetical protein
VRATEVTPSPEIKSKPRLGCQWSTNHRLTVRRDDALAGKHNHAIGQSSLQSRA